MLRSTVALKQAEHLSRSTKGAVSSANPHCARDSSTMIQCADARLVFLASSSLTTSVNAVSGCAPTNERPSMKNAGVPSTPSLLPWARSDWIAAAYFALSKQESNCVVLRPSCFAVAFRSFDDSLD